MEKQKLIEKWENKTSAPSCEISASSVGYGVARVEIIEDLKRLDEPQKVKVPECVAEYIEAHRKWGPEIFIGDWLADNDAVHKWLYNNSEKENNRRFLIAVKAFVEGYEVEESKWAVKEGDLVIRKGCHEAKVYFVEWVDDDGILLVNGIKDEFFTDLDDRSVGEESINYFYENFRLLAKKENLEAEKV